MSTQTNEKVTKNWRFHIYTNRNKKVVYETSFDVV